MANGVTVTGLIRSNDYCRRRPAGEAAAARTCTHACCRSGRRRVNRRFRNRACAICVAVKSNAIAFYRCVHCACIFDPHVGAKVKLESGKFRFAIFQCLQASTSYLKSKSSLIIIVMLLKGGEMSMHNACRLPASAGNGRSEGKATP